MVSARVVGILLALIFTFQAAPFLVPYVVPMSRYYELASVTVMDTRQGVSPRMIVDRRIHRQFLGQFEVALARAVGGGFQAWPDCGPYQSAWFTYYADPARQLPPDLDLAWWMDDEPCSLPPGRYKVVTTVRAQGPLGAVLSTTAESNLFTVTP